MTTNLRVSDSKGEIISLLNRVLQNNQRIIIWQNIDGKRVVNSAFINRINLKENTIVLKPFGMKTFKFSKKFSFYFHGNDMSMLFKTSATFNTQKMIIMPIPSEIRVIEKRVSPRTVLKSKVYNEICFEKIHGYSDKKIEFNFTVLDVSKTGTAFRIFSHDLGQFSVEQKIIIREISKVDVKQHAGIIRYIKAYRSKMRFGTNQVFRVGVEFSEPMPENILAKITKSL